MRSSPRVMATMVEPRTTPGQGRRQNVTRRVEMWARARSAPPFADRLVCDSSGPVVIAKIVPVRPRFAATKICIFLALGIPLPSAPIRRPPTHPPCPLTLPPSSVRTAAFISRFRSRRLPYLPFPLIWTPPSSLSRAPSVCNPPFSCGLREQAFAPHGRV